MAAQQCSVALRFEGMHSSVQSDSSDWACHIYEASINMCQRRGITALECEGVTHCHVIVLQSELLG